MTSTDPARSMVSRAHEPTPLSRAVDAFTSAVHDLCGRTVGWIERDHGQNHAAFGASRWAQLVDACTAGTGTGHGGHARSLPPVHVDAVDMRVAIDRAVIAWTGRFERGSTPSRLATLAEHGWVPGDETILDTMTDQLGRWCADIDRLLDPPHRWDLIAPCPQCGTTTVYRTDSAGETVRQPALSIADGECVCLHCATVWGVQHFEHLKRVIDHASGVHDIAVIPE